MNSNIIVADASPLIAFGRIKQISLISKTLGKIIIPQAVAGECLVEDHRPGAYEIQRAIEEKIISITPTHKIKVKPGLLEILDNGEANALSLALQLDAGILIDEKLGRDAAKKLNLKTIGTAGVLLLAKKKKLIKNISPIITELKNAGYYLSVELINAVLKQAKEKAD